MASDFDFDLPLNQYFLAEIAEHLESKGINCLDDLIDAMYEDPERWGDASGPEQRTKQRNPFVALL